MRTIAEYLPEHPFFAGLDESVAALVAGCAVNVHFRPGQHLFHEGEPADAFYVIRHGRVSIEVRTAAGPSVVVDTVHDDDVVGWSWLVPPYRWRFDARATEETSADRVRRCAACGPSARTTRRSATSCSSGS